MQRQYRNMSRVYSGSGSVSPVHCWSCVRLVCCNPDWSRKSSGPPELCPVSLSGGTRSWSCKSGGTRPWSCKSGGTWPWSGKSADWTQLWWSTGPTGPGRSCHAPDLPDQVSPVMHRTYQTRLVRPCTRPTRQGWTGSGLAVYQTYRTKYGSAPDLPDQIRQCTRFTRPGSAVHQTYQPDLPDQVQQCTGLSGAMH